MNTTPWIKAARSGGNNGACVEVRRRDDRVEVRDSKDPDGPILSFTRDEWDAFVHGAVKGEFDL
ncbi:MAG: hypothetical protein AUI14_11025 [Actinobacteria bacterium 13_2_20CM_2_71_6]|nr:MAG: hypothetical protein AUI14_11025 [Actinobacteria bacterium 13_2_20CM_2_71_6]